MKRIVVDLDGTLVVTDHAVPYADRQPNAALADQLRRYKAAGFAIVIATARNMRSFGASVGHINAHTLPVVIDWLTRHDIPFDEVHVGKPWCGDDGFYVDDRAVRPGEFTRLDHAQILALLAADAGAPAAGPPA